MRTFCISLVSHSRPPSATWTDTPTHTLTPGVGKKSLIAGHSILPALRDMCEAAGPDRPVIMLNEKLVDGCPPIFLSYPPCGKCHGSARPRGAHGVGV